MKIGVYILSFFLYSIIAHAQPFETEQAFIDHLINNIRTIDPIEGVWTGTSAFASKVVAKDGTTYEMPSFSSELRIIIIREGDYYIAYQSNKYRKQLTEAFKCFDYRFEKTATNGKYLFSFTCNELRSGEAYMSDTKSLSFGYKNLDRNSNGATSVEEGKVTLTKISLNDDDIKDALKEIPPKPNKAGGTAFAIGDRYIVTAWHVVEGFNKFRLKGLEGTPTKSYECILSVIDSINDMAILYITDISFQGIMNIPYSLKKTESKVGENVFCLGYPLTMTMGEEIKLTDGLISSKSGFMGNSLQYQISAPVQSGNSGCPLFDNNGNLIGIVIAKHSDAENASYALKISCLAEVIKNRPAISTLPSTSNLSQKDLPTKVSLIENYIYIIEAEE